MLEVHQNSTVKGTVTLLVVAFALAWLSPASLWAAKKKKQEDQAAPAAAPVKDPDFSNIVFPAPPSVPRLKYMDYFSAERLPVNSPAQKQQQPKTSWMDRLAGVEPGSSKDRNTPKTRFQLLEPYGLAVDSKGRIYVADTKVGAIFIFNTENNDVELIKHGVNAKFGSIFGLAMDDNDRLFVSDGQLRHVLVFNAQHKLEAGFGDGLMADPNGIAIDTENRFLYVADTGLDQVLVYDADTFKLLRKIGTTGQNHTLTDPGNFAKPTNVAVDKDGNLYVSDTYNDRVEVFDADGLFIRTFGKNGDGPGDFARPKGIAIDADGHVWVADAMLNRIQVFTPEGHLLLAMGSFGIMPGQFSAVAGLTIDKQNRVFTSEQLLGRVQMYRYYTNTEAKAELARRELELEKKAQERRAAANPASDAKPPQGSEAQTGETPPARPAMKLPDPPAPAAGSAPPKS